MENEAAQTDLFYLFGTALLIGLLVGLQREFVQVWQKEEEKCITSPASPRAWPIQKSDR